MTEDDVSEQDEQRRERLQGRFDSYSSSPDGDSEEESAEETVDTQETMGTVETQDTEEPGETEETEETQETPETLEQVDSKDRWKGETVRERDNINFYVPEEVVDEVQNAYAELNAEYRREYGEDLEKNSQFYPHLLQTAVEDSKDDLRDRLGLDS